MSTLYYTPSQLSEASGLCLRTIYNHARRGRLKGVRWKGGGRWRFRSTAVCAWAEFFLHGDEKRRVLHLAMGSPVPAPRNDPEEKTADAVSHDALKPAGGAPVMGEMMVAPCAPATVSEAVPCGPGAPRWCRSNQHRVAHLISSGGGPWRRCNARLGAFGAWIAVVAPESLASAEKCNACKSNETLWKRNGSMPQLGR